MLVSPRRLSLRCRMRFRTRRPTKDLSMNSFATKRWRNSAQLPANVQMQIYRMVQEAVSNIWRHAGATHVKMTVDAAPDGDFVLQLEDNGRDFRCRRSRRISRGRGLANMRARASLIDAEISWEKLDWAGPCLH